MEVGIFESEKKKLRIQTFPDTCGRDLYLITSTRKLKDHSTREGICELLFCVIRTVKALHLFRSCWPSSGGHIWLLAAIRNE